MPAMKTTQQMRDELLLRGRFKQWFGNSVVADKKGRPKPVYHSTDQQFSVFKTDGLGFHVGTKGQARDIGGSRMIKAYASLQNPLRMPDMGERWDSAPRMTDALLDQGTLTDEEGAAIMGQPRESQLQALKSLLISKGHDGIVYENEHEGRGGDSYLLFHPHQIKATTNKAPTMSPDIHMAAGGSVQRMRDELLLKGMAGGGAVKAPVTPTGFYSPLEEAALNIQRKVGNAQAFMNDLRSVPKEHLQHAGVDKLLTSRPTITREELQQHIARAAPKVEVKVMGGGRGLPPILSDYFENTTVRQPTTTEGWIAEAARQERKARQFQAQGNDRLANRFFELADAMNQHAESGETGASATKYSKYTVPGGSHYREVLLTLPRNLPSTHKAVQERNVWYVRDEQGNGAVDGMGETKEKAIEDFFRGQERWAKSLDYRSSHWDEPNVLAHFRINDRTDKDGKKVLFVEEIQSDWGQEGKKEGFKDEAAKIRAAENEARSNKIGARISEINRQMRDLPDSRMSEFNVLADERQKLYDEQNRLGEEANQLSDRVRGQIPSAPFVTKTNDWVNLALKHILKMAAEEGHDRVAFVKGEQAADRFGLDKHFSRVTARPTPTGGYQLQTILKDGSREDSVDVPPNKLHEYVGEDLAKKIHAQGGGVFEGGDLRMPQMGMRKFYDELVPQQAHALVKKFGGQGIKPIHLPTPPKVDPYKGLSIESDDGQFAVTLDGHVIERHPSEAEAREAMRYIDPGFWRGEIEAGGFRRINRPPETYQGFDITPEMRQAILKPMSYKVGGAVPAMDAMRLQVWNKRRGR